MSGNATTAEIELHTVTDDNGAKAEEKSDFDIAEGMREILKELRAESCVRCGNALSKPENIDITNERWEKMQKKNFCAECYYLDELDINKTLNVSGFTEKNWFPLIFGIVCSPVFFIWIPFFAHLPMLLLFCIIATITTFFLGIILWYPSYKLVKSWTDKYFLAPPYWPHFMIISLFILNVTVVVELLRNYMKRGENLVYDCYFDTDDAITDIWDQLTGDDLISTTGTFAPIDAADLAHNQPHCIVYLNLISNATIVFFCTLIVNIATLNNPISKAKTKEDSNLSDSNDRLASLKSLQNDPEKYIGKCIAIIEELREGYNPHNPIRWFCSAASLKQKFWGQIVFEWVLVLGIVLFCVGLPLSSMFTHRGAFFQKTAKQPLYLISLIPSYLVAMFALQITICCFYKLNNIYQKAYALMKISGREDGIRGEKKSRNAQDDEKYEYLHPGTEQKENGTFQHDGLEINGPKYFFRWWNLRDHIVTYELPYYYELTDPILALEVIGSGLLTFFFMFQFYFNYKADVAELMNSVFTDNFRCMLFIFMIMLMTTTLWNISWVMKAYEESKTHMAYIQTEIQKLKFELSNTRIESKNMKDKFEKQIAICEYMCDNMDSECLAPTVLGITLNDTLVISIKAYFSAFLIAFAGTMWQDFTGGGSDE